MEHNLQKATLLNSKQFGLHYYPDSLHYRSEDLEIWLPELKVLGASWLILQGETNRAIPEDFLHGLLKENIEPILHFPLSLANPITPDQIEPLLNVYAKWGIHYVIFFDRPNSRSAWGDSNWSQNNLVERYVDQFFPLAEIAVRNGLSPVLSPLEPGGPYWDTVFLRQALEIMQSRDLNGVLDKLALSAYGWSFGKSLNWGLGGPDCWPQTKPYRIPAGSEDQRGFRIFDWYQAISNAVLQKPSPMILLQTGLPADPLVNKNISSEGENIKGIVRNILRLLDGENVYDPNSQNVHLESVPEEVICCNFWLLSSEDESPFAAQRWYSGAQQKSPLAQAILEYRQEQMLVNEDSEIDNADQKKIDEPSFTFSRYLLLPSVEYLTNNSLGESIHNYINRYKPAIGFSLAEAARAAVVAIVDEKIFSEIELDCLSQHGCLVQKLNSAPFDEAQIIGDKYGINPQQYTSNPL